MHKKCLLFLCAFCNACRSTETAEIPPDCARATLQWRSPSHHNQLLQPCPLLRTSPGQRSLMKQGQLLWSWFHADLHPVFLPQTQEATAALPSGIPQELQRLLLPPTQLPRLPLSSQIAQATAKTHHTLEGDLDGGAQQVHCFLDLQSFDKQSNWRAVSCCSVRQPQGCSSSTNNPTTSATEAPKS